MSQELDEACFFDNSKQCPVRKAGEFPSDALVLEKACPICPIRAEMMRKAGFGEM